MTEDIDSLNDELGVLNLSDSIAFLSGRVKLMDSRTTQDMIQRFYSIHDDASIDEKGISAAFFLDFFPVEPETEVFNQLAQHISEAEKSPRGLFNKTMMVSRGLEQQVRIFFATKTHPHDFYKPAMLNDPLANTFINLKCRQLVDKYSGWFSRQPGLAIEFQIHPQTGKFGVWMSTKGESFNPDKVV